MYFWCIWYVCVCGAAHLSLSSAAFSASSSFVRAVARRSCARSNSSSTSWIRLFREATSLSAYRRTPQKECRQPGEHHLAHTQTHIWSIVMCIFHSVIWRGCFGWIFLVWIWLHHQLTGLVSIQDTVQHIYLKHISIRIRRFGSRLWDYSLLINNFTWL